jgi:hypothetical protein
MNGPACIQALHPNLILKNKTMGNIRSYVSMLLILLMFTMSSCEIIGDIFEAGMWTALIIIVLIIALVGWIFSKLRR